MSLPMRYARLLPDFRTLFLAFDDLDQYRREDETPAETLTRAIRYADRVFNGDGSNRRLADRLVQEAGLPEDDDLGAQLAMALVARAKFLAEQAGQERQRAA